LQQDKNEIFRAAHDASAITDYLLAFERDRSIESQQVSAKPARNAQDIPFAGSHGDEARSSPPNQSNELANSLAAAQSITAKALGACAKVLQAQTESGIYDGIIIGETARHLVQRQSAHNSIAHPKDLLDRPAQVGDHVCILYANSNGRVQEVRRRAKQAELGR